MKGWLVVERYISAGKPSLGMGMASARFRKARRTFRWEWACS